MKEHRLTGEGVAAYVRWLREEERSPGTIEKYLRDLRQFAAWLGEREVTKEGVIQWKKDLCTGGKEPATINGKLAALNSFLTFAGWPECRVKGLKLQRRLFRERGRALSREEYQRLTATAREAGKERLALLMETICATGIRVSEVKDITLEAVRAGRAEISLKGKIRAILLPGKLCRKLRKYARAQKITSGALFLTRSGRPLSRKQIWAEMKTLCQRAGVEATKVFPHNLRRLFARCFYGVSRDLASLADVLGHSSIETTRIYLMSTGEEHVKTLERLGLVG